MVLGAQAWGKGMQNGESLALGRYQKRREVYGEGKQEVVLGSGVRGFGGKMRARWRRSVGVLAGGCGIWRCKMSGLLPRMLGRRLMGADFSFAKPGDRQEKVV